MLLDYNKEVKAEQQLQDQQSLQDELNQLDADTFEVEDLADTIQVAGATTSSTCSTSTSSTSS